VDAVQKFIERHRGEPIQILVQSADADREVSATPRVEPPAGEGPLGIAMARIGIVRSPWWRAPWDGLKTAASASVAIIQALGNVAKDFVSQGELSEQVSGPVGIFVFADETRQLGAIYLVELAGVLSINLAVLNILPIPALDGGRILFLFFEKIRGVRTNQRVEQFVHTVGFAVLLLLMAAITYRDLVRIF
jgi:regulator of sigma E protease